MRPRFLAIAAVLLATQATAQDTGCRAEWLALMDLLEANGAIDERPTGIARTLMGGECQISALRLPIDRRTAVQFDDMTWSGLGMGRFTRDGLPPTGLRVEIEGASLPKLTGDRATDQMIGQFWRGRSADVTFDAAWRQASDRVTLNEFSVKFEGGDAISLRADVDGVDLSDEAAMQMSGGAFSVPVAVVSVVIDDMFAEMLAMGGLPDRAALDAFLDRFPQATLSPASRYALRRLTQGDPRGVLTIEIDADPGLGPLRFMPMMMAGRTVADPEFWDGIELGITFFPR